MTLQHLTDAEQERLELALDRTGPRPWPDSLAEEIAEADRLELLMRGSPQPRSNKAVANVFALLDEIDRKANQ